MNAILLFLLAAIVLPLALSEFGDWCPWLAIWLVRWSARRLGDPQACERYLEEWVANLNEVPGKLSRLAAAFWYVVNVPRMRWSLGGKRRSATSTDADPIWVPAGSQLKVLHRVRRALMDGEPARLVVVGSPGTGKTTLMAHLARESLRFAGRRLVSMSPAKWEPAQRCLQDFIAAHIEPARQPAQDLIDNGPPPVLLLDGLDEMPEPLRAVVLAMINSQWLNATVVITCRTNEFVAMRSDAILRRAEVISIDPPSAP